MDGGVFEIALLHRGDAFRVLYAVQIGDDLWVIHAFQKKSKSGIKTPQIGPVGPKLRFWPIQRTDSELVTSSDGVP